MIGPKDHAAATLMIRPARNEDGPAFGWLIARCWADYPGCYFDRHGELGDLDRIANVLEARGGQAWSALIEDRIVGSICVAPAGEVGSAWEITKLYVDPNIRRQNIASLLLGRAEDFAGERGARRMILWTDTRFEGAHRFYERLGYVADGRVRELHDLSNSVEYFYAKHVGG